MTAVAVVKFRVILIHAIRLHEGTAQHPGGNYHHMHYLLRALLPRAIAAGLDVQVLVDELGERDLATVVPRERMHVVGSSTKGILSCDSAIRATVRRLRPEIYYRPTGQLPFGRLPCRTVMGVADLNFRWVPMPWTKRLYKELSYGWSFHLADRIVTVSEFTKKDIIEKYHIPAEKLQVIHHGASELPSPTHLDLPVDRFWITFGHQAHKNVELCLNVLRASKPGEVLVVIGQSDHISQVLRPMAIRLGLERRVLFVGRISGGQLHWLYQRAVALLFMSKFEGFGLPVVEAMRAGCPVICSPVCSIPEVAGDAGLIVPPDRADLLLAAMESLADHTKREALIDRGRAQARRFSWDTAADRTIEILRTLLP